MAKRYAKKTVYEDEEVGHFFSFNNLQAVGRQ
jgi:hypothetical protein